ncbi:N-terminal L-serine N(alpha)-acetyltransferase NatD [Saccharomyces eubayanus]|uniref:N-terminal L-serine N(alpha)-acetyltransferase NatD n=1 Tax=Saccharomyces eubayanus TaxID=1080349 RepID=UPI0006C23DC0|nr:NAT4-like protein [Saccharomyces eubayanus]KOG97410.1 NAT4-like protein [Saccharomyces eubayanus]
MFQRFLSICIDEFPETLDYTGRDENGNSTTTVLHRQMMYVPEDDDDSIDTLGCMNYTLHKADCDQTLHSCVQLVDEHLGAKYRRASRTMYGNRLPWKANKLAEMKSAGLIYVCYWGNDVQGVRALGAFVSFMYTEETGLVEGDAAHEVSVPVIYLYEVHVACAHRGRGLGRRLLTNSLCEGVARRVRRMCDDFFGVALTVFGDNTRARRLYESLEFQRAPGSPVPIAAPPPRVTRRGHGARAPVARDPLYYVYCLHLA